MSDVISKAREFATTAHASIDQRRKFSNQPYIIHPASVANIVTSVTDDVEMIAAAWLHDVVEDTPVELMEIKNLFGSAIADLVDQLTDPATPADGNRQERAEINRRHTASITARGKTVKLADVIDNLDGILEVSEGFAKRFVQEKSALCQVLEDGHQNLFQQATLLLDESKRKLTL